MGVGRRAVGRRLAHTNPLLLALIVGGRRLGRGGAARGRRDQPARPVPAHRSLRHLPAGRDGGSARRRRHRSGRDRPPAGGAAARVDERRAPGRGGHARGPARRGVRGDAAGRDPRLPRRGERPGQPPAAAALRPRHALRGGHRGGRGADLRPADGRGRRPRARCAPAARPLRAGHARAGAAGRAGARGRARALARASRRRWSRAATAASCAGPPPPPGSRQCSRWLACSASWSASTGCSTRRVPPCSACRCWSRACSARPQPWSSAPGATRGPATAATPGACPSGSCRCAVLVPAATLSVGAALSWPGITPQQVPAALPPVPLGIVASIAVAALAGVLAPVPPLLARSREAVA